MRYSPAFRWQKPNTSLSNCRNGMVCSPTQFNLVGLVYHGQSVEGFRKAEKHDSRWTAFDAQKAVTRSVAKNTVKVRWQVASPSWISSWIKDHKPQTVTRHAPCPRAILLSIGMLVTSRCARRSVLGLAPVLVMAWAFQKAWRMLSLRLCKEL